MKSQQSHDFSHARSNPYARSINRSITVALDPAAVSYFEQVAAQTGFTTEQLLQDCLRESVLNGWRPAGPGQAPNAGEV